MFALGPLVSKRVPSERATERDSESAILAGETGYSVRKREYCYEEGSFRGAFHSASKLADNPLTKIAERFVSRRFAFRAYSARVSRRTGLPPKLSVSKNAFWGAVPTMGFGFDPRNQRFLTKRGTAEAGSAQR